MSEQRLSKERVVIVLHCRHEPKKTVQLYGDCPHCEIEHLRYMVSPAERVNDVVPLLPCPFDSGPAILYASRSKYRGDSDKGEMFECYVWCHECGAQGPRTEELVNCDTDIHGVKLLASDRWNSLPGRQPREAPNDERQRFRKALVKIKDMTHNVPVYEHMDDQASFWYAVAHSFRRTAGDALK